MRWLGFALRLILLLALIAWLIDQPGAAQIVWHGYVIETSASVLALVGVGAVFILFSLFRLWRFLLDGPRFWRMRQKIKKIERGQDQLAQGLVAIAAGDGAEAGRLAVGATQITRPYNNDASFAGSGRAIIGRSSRRARNLHGIGRRTGKRRAGLSRLDYGRTARRQVGRSRTAC